jgi:ABC-2 type transport system ATP-binding protein
VSPVGLQVDSLTRRYGRLTAVAEASFAVQRGEMFGLIGPDGAGKTTTLRVALGLLAAHGGRVMICGLDPVRQHRELSRRVGYLPQRFSLYGDLTVDENIAFFAELHGVDGLRPLRDELLDMVRMTPFRARLADRLSGGMKQKLALVCTLIHTPELLILDEPTSGVDPVSRRDFWKLLARLQRDGLTIVVTTPYLDEAERCGRVALMDHGHVLMVDAPQAIRAGLEGVLVEIVARPRRRAQEIVRGLPGVLDVEVFGERLHATLAASSPLAAGGAKDLGGRLQSMGVEVESVRTTTPTLEDVFIHMLRARAEEGAQEVEVS